MLSVPYAFHATTAKTLAVNTISIPAYALAFDPSSTTVTRGIDGLQCKQDLTSGGRFAIKKPSNYAGNDVELSIYFKTTTSTAGVVDFFIRPVSYNHGEGDSDGTSISSTGVNVSGALGFGTLYEQKFTIPADRLEKNWWQIIIQNKGKASTYTGVVILKCVSLTY